MDTNTEITTTTPSKMNNPGLSGKQILGFSAGGVIIGAGVVKGVSMAVQHFRKDSITEQRQYQLSQDLQSLIQNPIFAASLQQQLNGTKQD